MLVESESKYKRDFLRASQFLTIGKTTYAKACNKNWRNIYGIIKDIYKMGEKITSKQYLKSKT